MFQTALKMNSLHHNRTLMNLYSLSLMCIRKLSMCYLTDVPQLLVCSKMQEDYIKIYKKGPAIKQYIQTRIVTHNQWTSNTRVRDTVMIEFFLLMKDVMGSCTFLLDTVMRLIKSSTQPFNCHIRICSKLRYSFSGLETWCISGIEGGINSFQGNPVGSYTMASNVFSH